MPNQGPVRIFRSANPVDDVLAEKDSQCQRRYAIKMENLVASTVIGTDHWESMGAKLYIPI